MLNHTQNYIIYQKREIVKTLINSGLWGINKKALILPIFLVRMRSPVRIWLSAPSKAYKKDIALKSPILSGFSPFLEQYNFDDFKRCQKSKNGKIRIRTHAKHNLTEFREQKWKNLLSFSLSKDLNRFGFCIQSGWGLFLFCRRWGILERKTNQD